MSVKFVGKTSTLPISTMLYMTEEDLQERLKILTNLFKLDYAYICHKGEGGKKNHIHICLRTKSKQFQNIDKIRECLFEICDTDTDTYKKGQSKPCKPFVETKSLRDWYLYSMHNKDYLNSKNEVREFEYSPEDIKGSANLIEDMKELTAQYQPKLNDFEIIHNGIMQGLNDIEILQQFKTLEAQTIAQTLRGIEKMRSYYEADASQYQKAVQNLATCLSWEFDEKGLREVVFDFESNQKVRLNYSKLIARVIVNAIASINRSDFYQACCDIEANELPYNIGNINK